MKAIINTKRGEVVLREVPLREVGPEEVKVKLAYCAIAGGDIFIIDSGLPGVPLPWPMGHQGSGTIVEAGKGVTARGLKVGDRVALNQLHSCGACYECLSGHGNFCSKRQPYYGWVDSLMAEYVVFHQQQVYKLPDSISLEEGALTEVVAASMAGIELAQMKLGNSVLISGGGGNGLMLLQLARLQGGTKVTVIEPVESKRQLALKLGADYVLDPKNQDIVAEAMKITDNRGFDRVIEASGVTDAIPPCLDMVGRVGRIILFANYPNNYKLTVDIDKLYLKEAGIQMVFGFTNNIFLRALAIMPKLDLKSMIGPIYPLDEFQEAFEAHRKAQYPKILVKC